jgi:hypothetical protein
MQNAAYAFTGVMRIKKTPGTNKWIADWNGSLGSSVGNGGGEVTLSGDLNNFRLGRGSGNFDGGSFWYRYK